MENASKALIIAGAILLAILIISLGIWIFSSAQNTIESAGDMSEQTATTFNNKFSASLGDRVQGSEVNALIQAVRSSNQKAAEDGDMDKLVSIYTNNATLNGDTVTTKTRTKTGSNVSGTGTVSTTITANGSSSTSAVTGKVATGNTYQVTCNYYRGYINEICIKAN